MNDFWTADVGLYAPAIEQGPVAELTRWAEQPMEEASGFTKDGYRYRMIGFEGEAASTPHRFAVCATPESYDVTGRNTFIISHENILYYQDLEHGRGIDVYPPNPALQGWTELD